MKNSYGPYNWFYYSFVRLKCISKSSVRRDKDIVVARHVRDPSEELSLPLPEKRTEAVSPISRSE